MAAAADRANIGYDEARMEGRGPVGSAVDAAKAAAGRGTNTGPYDNSGLENRGALGGAQGYQGGMMGRTEEELARLQNRSVITSESEPYAPNPNIKDLPKEFETRVQVVQKYPEMKTVEKTDMVKEVRNEERTVTVPKTRVVMDEVERVDRVPVVREVPKTRIETVHRVVTEDREVTDMVPVVEYTEVPKVEQVPRVITDQVEERVRVPVVVEVPVTRQVEVPTGNFVEAPVEQIVQPGHAGILQGEGGTLGQRGTFQGEGDTLGEPGNSQGEGVLNRTSSSSSLDDEVDTAPVQQGNLDGNSYGAPAQPRKKKGLLNKILHH